jgi:uncharacterized protein (TIGR03437 family)
MKFRGRVRAVLAVLALFAGTCDAAAPSYSAAGIVNASNFALGPFAPGSVVSIFGTDLARSRHAVADSDLVGCKSALVTARCLPLELNYVRVYVQDQPVPLLFVDPAQVNFLISTSQIAGPARIRVVTEGNSGPEIVVNIVDAAPALFTLPGDYVIAQDAKGNLLTADAPAHAGDIVVVYLTGLGRTVPNPTVGEIPGFAGTMLAINTLRVTLNGAPVDPYFIKYAGLTPGCAGLYQINLYVPEETGEDPEIQVTAGDLAAQTGLKLPLR